MSSVVEAIRSLYIPLATANIIVPNSAIAEVVGHQDADQEIENSLDWFLGKMKWREQMIPLISFDEMLGKSRSMASSTSRLVIIKCLGENVPFSYYAIETKTTPKVLSIYPFVFEPYESDDDEVMHEIFSCQCMLNGDVAAIPDINKIELDIAKHWSGIDAELTD